MKTKITATLGLTFIIISQVLFYQGFEFLQAQKPIDFAHWLLLIGACMSIAFSFIFPKSIINTVSTALTVLGIVAHIGMCTVDLALWSYGTDEASRNDLVGHLMNTPSIWIPFFTIGPSLLYIGLASQVWQFIRSHTTYALITLVGSALIGFGQFIPNNRIFAVIGMFLFALGLILLVFRKED